MKDAQLLYDRRVSRRKFSPRVRDLIREGSWIALNPSPEWLEDLDRATLAAHPSIADDPELAAVVSRSNRANLIHFAAAHLRDPGAPVPPHLGEEQLHMARELVRRGLDTLALEIYRIGHNVALRRWTEIAFGLTSDPHELRDLIDAPFLTANEYVDATLAKLAARMAKEHEALTRDLRAERRKFVELILDGAATDPDRAELQLGYSLNRSHIAAIIWSDDPDSQHDDLDEAADGLGDSMESPQTLTVFASSATRWVWLGDVATYDLDRVRQALDLAPHTRVAIGTVAEGIDGFRSSHNDALTTQRMLARLKSPQRIACFDDVELVALLTQNPAAGNFIKNTLGDFESASPTLHETVLTYINEQCNTSRTAKALYIHRNTLLHRLGIAERLLPRPLEYTTVRVGVALEALRWRGYKTSGSMQLPTEPHHDSVPVAARSRSAD